MSSYLGYKFAVKGYYIQDAEVLGSEFQTKEMIHPSLTIRYVVEGRCRVKPLHLHCAPDLVAVMIEEGDHKGRLAFAKKCDLKKVFQ